MMYSRPTPLQTMADGTIKQVNPFSGTEVWTVPGRGNRPLNTPVENVYQLSEIDFHETCAFCDHRLAETTPEKSRITTNGDIKYHLLCEEQDDNYAFRRVGNLFEIVTFDYWQKNYDFIMSQSTIDWMRAYLATDSGRQHVLDRVRAKLAAAQQPTNRSDAELLELGEAFFGGGHDVIIAHRHFRDGALTNEQRAGSGDLSIAEHRHFMKFTVDSLRDLYQHNRYALYVAVFQNWLRPAGASFDHLHKQLVTIDDRGTHIQQELSKLRRNPNMYNEWAVDYAARRNLIIAENEHAVCFAGFGHRYPTLEVFSKSATSEPWLHSDAERNSMSDLLHAAHTATGSDVPSNEEWHHKPIDVDMPMPWRIMVKWRVSNLAGFEGGTKIYLNTLSPWDIRDRVVDRLFSLRKEGRIDPSIRIATETSVERNSLRYNPWLD
ncbi:galactose-1-phosphate uridylyltransferase [Corynebacterium kutscheri]|nr:galactose-1-phosphate uridylyltransferase [Corynebacterium kutscheri]